jgi:exosome complex RNA-binding protein Csl4
MKKEIWRILKDLEKDKITTNEAYNSLCVLFGVIKSVCPDCSSELKDNDYGKQCSKCLLYV